MDQYTYNALDKRLHHLEFQLGLDANETNESKKPIISQLYQLQKCLNEFYSSNAEFETLNRIINDLDVYDKKKETPKELSIKINAENNESENVDMTMDMKKEMVLLKYPAIQEAYNNLVQLSNIDIPKVINYIDASQQKTHNFNNDNYELLERQQKILDITNNFHLLVVKNMIVFEKYLSMMLRENKYWVNVDEQLQLLRTKIMASGKRHAEQGKY